MKKLSLLLLLLSFGTNFLSAKDDKISQNANWMINLNGEAFHESRMGKFIMDKMNQAPKINQKMQGLKNAFGVNLMDIREIYAFGSGEKDQGTAVLSGGINSKQLGGFASLNDAVEIDEYLNTKTFSFKKGALAILSNDSVAIASNKELLKDFLNRKNGNKKNPLRSFIQSIDKKNTRIMTFAANVLKVSKHQNKTNPAHEAILKKFKNMALTIDESGDDIHIKVYFQALNKETANHLENIFRSWPSIIALAEDAFPANTEMDELMNNVEFFVDRTENTISMTAILSCGFFETKMQEATRRMKGFNNIIHTEKEG